MHELLDELIGNLGGNLTEFAVNYRNGKPKHSLRNHGVPHAVMEDKNQDRIHYTMTTTTTTSAQVVKTLKKTSMERTRAILKTSYPLMSDRVIHSQQRRRVGGNVDKHRQLEKGRAKDEGARGSHEITYS